MSSLLAVSSAHDTVHIFKLGGQQRPSSSSGSTTSTSTVTGASTSGKNGKDMPGSPPESVDSGEALQGQGLDAGYEAFMEKKKAGSGVS